MEIRISSLEDNLPSREVAAILSGQLKFADLADAMPQMIWSARPDGFKDFCNRRWHDFTGIPEGGVFEGTWQKLIHPDDWEKVIERWSLSLLTGQDYEFQHRIRHRSGEFRWVIGQASPVRDEAGDIERWFGTYTDIHEKKVTEEALAESEGRLRLAIETTGLGIWDADLVTGKSEWSSEARRIVGISLKETIDQDTFLRWVHPEDRPSVERELILTNGLDFSGECRIIRANDGQERWVAFTGRTIFNAAGLSIRKLGTMQDITDRKQSRAALEASEERLRLALRAARMFAWEQDPVTNHITRSEHAKSLVGIGSGPLEELLERVSPEDREKRKRFMIDVDCFGSGTMEFRFTRPDGDTIWLASRAKRAASGHIVGVTYDITDRKAAEEEFWQAANHDALTGLPNRALFQKILDRELAAAQAMGCSLNLLMVDLDDFKDINDSLGHAAGDTLLKEAADRLIRIVSKRDMVARLGGDEFAVLIPNRVGSSAAAQVAHTILKTLRKPFPYEGRSISCRASIGIAACPEHDCEPAALMMDADIALYQAKAGGRNRAVVYSPEMRDANERRLSIIRQVRAGIVHGEFVPYYQPKISLSTGRVIGLEALTRWHHPARGILAPLEFDVAFADPELAAVMGKRLVGKVAVDLRRWLNAGLNPGRVAINLSSAEFGEATLADEILRLLDLSKIPTSHFEVEVTEKVLLEGRYGPVAESLEKYRRHGVQIALDDFGTGYASLTHLKQFPVDHIKIDKSFVQEIDDHPTNHAIVAAVIGLGRAIGLQVTAEGVETEAQAQRLREMGCHNAQGFLYSRPIPSAAVEEFLRRHT